MVMAVVDSGTTNTRVRRMEDGRVTDEFRRNAGARDGKKALQEALSQMLAQVPDADRVILSGMITSPTGLVEIPHVSGPVRLEELPLVRRDFPEIDPRPFFFVPGVAFREGRLDQRDMMRGEETELLGYPDLSGNTVFLHAGSHHKAMRVESGLLSASATAVTGELIAALAEHTLLASSLSLSGEADLRLFEEAAELTLGQGISRAAFVLRMLDVQEHAPMALRLGWAYGMMAAEDLGLLLPMLQDRPKLVFYGKEEFCRAMMGMKRLEGMDAVLLTGEASDALAPVGAWKLGRMAL